MNENNQREIIEFQISVSIAKNYCTYDYNDKFLSSILTHSNINDTYFYVWCLLELPTPQENTILLFI